jgi:hypothetical protein
MQQRCIEHDAVEVDAAHSVRIVGAVKALMGGVALQVVNAGTVLPARRWVTMQAKRSRRSWKGTKCGRGL